MQMQIKLFLDLLSSKTILLMIKSKSPSSLYVVSKKSPSSLTVFLLRQYIYLLKLERYKAWLLGKDDTQNREAFHIFCPVLPQSLLSHPKPLSFLFILAEKRNKMDWARIKDGTGIVGSIGGADNAVEKEDVARWPTSGYWMGFFMLEMW